jgi:hypothetical protein
VVNAATAAPVGMYVRPLIVSAERWIIGPRSWSGMAARASQSRQKRVVATSWSAASSAVVGTSASSLQASAQ